MGRLSIRGLEQGAPQEAEESSRVGDLLPNHHHHLQRTKLYRCSMYTFDLQDAAKLLIVAPTGCSITLLFTFAL
jgi:hypothetical protein